VNSNGTPKFEVHHIYYASLYPKHPELHNPKNLVMLCIKCHNDMHSGKMRTEVFNKLEKKRGLKELFKTNDN
jgi:5-methylcytosine-specific restriction endonuclease McrA